MAERIPWERGGWRVRWQDLQKNLSCKTESSDENGDMEIRELRRADHDELADLIEEWVPNKAADLRSDRPFGQRYQELLAIFHGRIVGWLEGMHGSGLWNQFHGLPEEPEGPICSYIDFLYVPVSMRRHTVGTRLVQAFEADALAHGNTFVCLNPQPGEDEAKVQAFYRTQNYALAGDTAGHYHYLMGKHLA